MRFAYLRYDDGPRLRPTTNGYGYRSSERRDGSLKRLVIVARAGRNAVVVKYSAGDRPVGRSATCARAGRYASSAWTVSRSPTFAPTPGAS